MLLETCAWKKARGGTPQAGGWCMGKPHRNKRTVLVVDIFNKAVKTCKVRGTYMSRLKSSSNHASWCGLHTVYLTCTYNWTPVKSTEPKTWVTHDDRWVSCFNLMTVWTIHWGSISMILTWIFKKIPNILKLQQFMLNVLFVSYVRWTIKQYIA